MIDKKDQAKGQAIAIEIVGNLASKYSLEMIHLGCTVAAKVIEESTSGKPLDQIVSETIAFYDHLDKITIKPMHPSTQADLMEKFGDKLKNLEELKELKVNGTTIKLPASAEMN